MRMSLAAEKDGLLVGFLLGSLYYGEFGRTEPSATLEAIGVHPDFGGGGVAAALWQAFAKNVQAMRIERVETIVDWNDQRLLGFFHRQGFTLSTRICLERNLEK